MIKAVFFDVDGTLVSFRQKALSDRLLADLSALRERGGKIFLSTGRALQDLERTGMLRGLRFDGYLTLGGQYCCDADGTAFRDAPIGRDDLRGAYEVFLANPQLCAIMEGNGESYLTQINDGQRYGRGKGPGQLCHGHGGERRRVPGAAVFWTASARGATRKSGGVIGAILADFPQSQPDFFVKTGKIPVFLKFQVALPNQKGYTICEILYVF